MGNWETSFLGTFASQTKEIVSWKNKTIQKQKQNKKQKTNFQVWWEWLI